MAGRLGTAVADMLVAGGEGQVWLAADGRALKLTEARAAAAAAFVMAATAGARHPGIPRVWEPWLLFADSDHGLPTVRRTSLRSSGRNARLRP
jgi:predicted RNA polymerase sigma factor